MWFEECFPRGEARVFAGAVKEAMAYAEVKGREIAQKELPAIRITWLLGARSPYPPTTSSTRAEPLARPPLILLVDDNI